MRSVAQRPASWRRACAVALVSPFVAHGAPAQRAAANTVRRALPVASPGPAALQRPVGTSRVLARAALGSIAGGLAGLYPAVQFTCGGFTVDQICDARRIALASGVGTFVGTTVLSAQALSSARCGRGHRLLAAAAGTAMGFGAGAGVIALAGRRGPNGIPVLLLLEPLGAAVALRPCTGPAPNAQEQPVSAGPRRP